MRLSFPNGEHKELVLAPGVFTLGSAPDNSIVLAGRDVLPQHLRLIVDKRGVTLEVSDSAAVTHVNARPVREKAIVRLGDVVSVNSINFILKPGVAVSQPPPAKMATPDKAAAELASGPTLYRVAPPKAVLRGVSGPYFGKVIPISGRLTIGRGDDCDLILDEAEMSRHHAMLEISDQGLYLRDLGSSNGTYVNGEQIRNAILRDGDQLAFDRNRFLIEAPGLSLAEVDAAQARPSITQAMPAVTTPVSNTMPRPKNKAKPHSPWMLIVAGAIIATLLAVLILGRF